MTNLDIDIFNMQWDVLVIGGGSAGMMAAGQAAERGAKVLLIEKNDSLGKKLLITGGGRCNVTNAEFDTRTLLAKFKESDKFLFSAFSQWSVKETINFFNIREMQTKIEAEKRVFPVSDKAQSVWDVLVKNLKKHNVTILSDSPVTNIKIYDDSKTIASVIVKGKKEIRAKSFILATGGKSRPETGSTGDGFVWLKNIGHTVVDSDAALVPLTTSDEWAKKLAGVSLNGVKISLLQNNVKQDSRIGKILFTHVGVSGPTILNMSKDASELLKYGEVIMEIDTLPAFDYGKLNTRLQELFKEHDKKKFKNSLGDLFIGIAGGTALAGALVGLSTIDPDLACNSITREQRLSLVKLLKHLPLHITGLLGVEKAIVTSGGVSLSEIDFKTMQSRIYKNLYLVGDILNIDRPSGGYSLQLCWTTGFVAGNNVEIPK